MNNDLISREALKKELEEIISGNPVSIFKDGIVRALKAIDNAPTVENITVFCENANEETLEDIKKELKKVLDKLKERNNG